MTEYFKITGPKGGAIVNQADAARVTKDWEALVARFGFIGIQPYVAPPPPLPPVVLRPLMWVDDEVARSSDPARHAADLVANCVRYGFAGVALKMADTLAQNGAATLLRDACTRVGVRFGTWDDANLHPDDVIRLGRSWASTFHIVQVEAPQQGDRWTDAQLNQLPPERAVVFIEGAVTNPTRWRTLGFKAMPEANLAENSQATIGAMLDLAVNKLGWPIGQVAPVLYLIRDTAAARYSPEIGATGGRWSVFRYGDVDQTDWDTMVAWPRA